MSFWSSEQAHAFLVTAQVDRLYALFALALCTGMRQGELFGLRWQDVNLETGAVNIHQAVQRSRTAGLRFAAPKTSSSSRTIAIESTVTEILRAHLIRQEEERENAGEMWRDLDLVFTDALGGALSQSNVRQRHLIPLMEQAGVPLIRFHDLRHSAASIMIAQGTPVKVVSEMLGHASVILTLSTYEHTEPKIQRSAAAALADVLFS